MHNITLISTIHSENGRCNSDELYEILKDIKPEVIFDEMPQEYCDMFYSDSFDIYCANKALLNQRAPAVPLEVKCIKRYKQDYNVKIIPVDIDVKQKLAEYQREINSVFYTIFNHEDFIKLDHEREKLIAKEGFEYLNSDKFLDLSERMDTIEKNIVESEIKNERLIDIYNLFKAEQHENREKIMLQNIYNYSKKNQYNQAVFLIGANHKKSIMQKIINYEKLLEIKLNWTMYSPK